jgi:hypothetical protein
MTAKGQCDEPWTDLGQVMAIERRGKKKMKRMTSGQVDWLWA